MRNYKLICIDMFQTLVNIQSRSNHIWKRILQDEYSEDLKTKYVRIVGKEVVNKFHAELSQSITFRNLKEIFFQSFIEIFEQEGVDYCPKIATEIFIDEHNKAELYDDSIQFITQAKQKYEICLVSDADIEMVKSHIEKMEFDNIFISETTKAYKGNPNGKMFESIIEHYNLNPKEILHIGDSSSDIIGANSKKIDTCWINRHDYKKKFDIIPTYEIQHLSELNKVLNLNVLTS